MRDKQTSIRYIRYMTKRELDIITNNITEIESEISILDSSNVFEARKSDMLIARLDYLATKLEGASIDLNKTKFRLIRKLNDDALISQ